MGSKYWTAAVTKFCEENRAAHHVERQGFEFYLPRVIETHGSREKRDFLFPGYIFILVSHGWERLISTRGIKRLFFCGDSPSRMRVSDIESIKRREDRDGFIRLNPRLGVGSEVVVNSGSFKDVLGVVESMTARDRCMVLLTMMERTMRVNVSISAVQVRIPQ